MTNKSMNHDFDFWLGDWNVYWEDKRGTNRINKILDGAVIQENFEGDGLIGISVPFSAKRTTVGTKPGYQYGFLSRFCRRFCQMTK